MIFQPGDYYVGDPGFVLKCDDLRALFNELLREKGFRNGTKPLLASLKMIGPSPIFLAYWSIKLPHKTGTLYDQDGIGWGFDWGVFGCVPFDFIDEPKSNIPQKINFNDLFECSFVDDVIKIGHLTFTLAPVNK